MVLKADENVSYSDRQSLARLLGRVEKRIARSGVFALISVALAGSVASPKAVRADGELVEPQPWPQSVPANSDFQEASALLKQRKWAEAAIALRSVLNRDARMMPAITGLAQALTYSGRREEALGVLNEAILHERGSRKAALVAKLQVLSRLFLTNATFQIYQDGLNLVRFRRFRLARERFEKALAQEPDNVEILVRIGQCLLLENDNDSAAERLKLARKLNPFEPEIHLWLGRALHQRGELADAVLELHSARADLKESELAPLWYADALFASGQKSGAVQALEEDVKSHPLHIEGLYLLAEFRLEVLPPEKREQGLWSVRQDLQVALSRLPQYDAAQAPRFETELGLELRKPEDEFKGELRKLLQKVDSQLAEERS